MRTKSIRRTATASLLALALAPAVWAQGGETDLRQEIEALKQGQKDINRELQEIKRLLQARPAAAAAPSGPRVAGKIFDLGDNPAKGASTAKLTLVEFTDYQ